MISATDLDRIAHRRVSVVAAVRDYAAQWSAYVAGTAASRTLLDECRAVGAAAVGRYMLDLADLINADQADDAMTMRAMAALLQTKTTIAPHELAKQADLAERLARLPVGAR
jgi:hypothetical protein